jgi:hypothetical protein
MTDTFDEFRKRVQHHQQDLRQVHDTVLYAQKIISKEKDIGSGQCSRIVKSMRSVEEPLRECYELLSTVESLPLPVKSQRHPLLIILSHTSRLLQDLIHSISTLHIICKTSPYQEANMHRQYILEQLDDLVQSKNDVVETIDRLLLSANPRSTLVKDLVSVKQRDQKLLFLLPVSVKQRGQKRL